MKRIKRNCRTVEISNAGERIYNYYAKDESLANDTFLAGIMTSIKTQTDLLVDSIKRSKVLSTLDSADEVRDNKIRAVNYILLGYKYNPIAEIQEAAVSLWPVFDKYGISITSANYASESTLIESMIKDFKTAESLSKISELNGLQLALSQLQEAETTFATARLAYESFLKENSVNPCASDLKKNLLELINDKLIKYIEVMCMSAADTYQDFASSIETVIDNINKLVEKHPSKEKDKE